MSDIFIAHVEEDAEVALEIALGLEEAGYSTWCYEVDNIPGPSYLVQTGQRIEQAKAVVVVISPHSIGSHQVTREVVRAHESGKYFIPVRRDISHIEFQNRQPEWREAMGAASSISVTKDDAEVVTKRIIDGLEALGIHPKPRAATGRIEQIRRILTKLRESGILEGVAKPTVSARKSEAESIAAEVPYIKTVEKPSRRRSLIKKSSITAAAIAVITIVVILLSGGFVKYTLSTAVSPGGGTITPASGTYRDGAGVTLTATPAQGHAFDHWSGDASGTSNPVTITMDSDKSVTASFITVFKLATSISPGDDGSISLSPDRDVYKAGTEVTLTATAAEGCIFDHWSGSASGTTSTITITMDSDKSLIAHFEVVPEILFSDDFSNPDSGWPTGSTNDYESNYEDGEYYILVKKFGWTCWEVNRNAGKFTDSSLEIDARLIGSTNEGAHCGLVFRFQDYANYYVFLVSQNGFYYIGMKLNGVWTDLQSWTDSVFVNRGNSTNNLKVVCQGPQIEVYVNGHHLANVTDDSFAEGYVGMFVGTPESNDSAAFDNIRVYSLD